MGAVPRTRAGFMKEDTPLRGNTVNEELSTSKRLMLKRMEVDDITEDYVRWLNDPETNKFLEVRFTPQSRDSVEAYVRKNASEGSDTYHFGVIERDTGLLIGTVTFNHVDFHHLTAAISFVIGHPEARGKGYGTALLRAMIKTAKQMGARVLMDFGTDKPAKCSLVQLQLRNGFRVCGMNDRWFANQKNSTAVFYGYDL